MGWNCTIEFRNVVLVIMRESVEGFGEVDFYLYNIVVIALLRRDGERRAV